MTIQSMLALQAHLSLVQDDNLVCMLMLRQDVKLGIHVLTQEVGLIFVPMEQSLIKEYFPVYGGLSLIVKRQNNCMCSMMIFIKVKQEVVEIRVGDQVIQVLLEACDHPFHREEVEDKYNQDLVGQEQKV